MHDFHRATAQHIGRAHHQRIAQFLRRFNGLLGCADRSIGRLLQAQLLQHLLKASAVFRAIYHVRRSADNIDSGLFQSMRQFQRRLSAELHNHTEGIFHRYHFQYIFQRQRFKIQTVGSIIVGGHRFRVAVDHDGFIAVFTHCQRGMHAAIVKLDALSDTIRPAAQHHDFFVAGGCGFALLLVSGIHIGGIGGELGGAGVDTLEHRTNTQSMATRTHIVSIDTQQFRQTRIREAAPL